MCAVGERQPDTFRPAFLVVSLVLTLIFTHVTLSSRVDDRAGRALVGQQEGKHLIGPSNDGR